MCENWLKRSFAFGLMAMATIITGYAEVFSELGIGAAIIQRSTIKENELASVFWFGLILSVFFALFCFVAAPITAHMFNEPRVLPLTKAVAIIFIISGVQIVPVNLLKKDLNFKAIGLIEMVGAIVACCTMVLMAHFGAGVWTLLSGPIMNGFTKMLMVYHRTEWKPSIHFNFKEALSFIQFGIIVAASRSFYYMFEKSDKFFAGRVWSSQLIGYYSFAQQLAMIPTEKIVSLINQVSFSAFSQLQNDKDEFNKLYLKIIEFTAIIVLPLYIGSFLVAEELIIFLIGQQWLPAVVLFKFLCLAQIPRSINAVNNFVHISRGEPKLSLYINVVLTISMAISFYFAVQKGLNAIVIPWVTTYALISCGWIVFTLKKIGLNFSAYIISLLHPAIATAIMFLTVTISKRFFYSTIIDLEGDLRLLVLVSSIIFGGGTYVGYFLLFNRQVLKTIKNLRK